MISGRTVLAVIAARGRSKGLPGKNLADIGGKPTVAWSVAAGKNARRVDRLIISSDNRAIIAMARKAGCEVPFVRPARLATDTASIHDVLLHTLDALPQRFDYIVLLQATSPLRTGGDVDACIRLCHETGAPVISVTCAAKPPHWAFSLDRRARLRPLLRIGRAGGRRQSFAAAYIPNGAVYVAPVARFRRDKTFLAPDTRGYVMPPERSVDIDTKMDLLLARALIDDTRKFPSRKTTRRTR
jgi:N-acylneuraminate cytidylyltransferase